MPPQTFLEPGLGLEAQLLGLVAAAGGGKPGQNGIAHRDAIGTALRHHYGVIHRLGHIREQHPHFLRRLEAVLGRQAAALLLA